MKYLHHRDIIHGRLKSRNCVVDGRFVLKVTDYGFNEILIGQSIDMDEEKPEGMLTNHYKNKQKKQLNNHWLHFMLVVFLCFTTTDLLWTAPELLRNPSQRKRGTFLGDVYSFAIVAQEVISRSAPFCMLDMPTKGER